MASGFPISRRAVLRGTGVALALPWLEAMRAERALAAPAAGRPSEFPVRMAVLFMPNGVHEDLWTPEGAGRDFQLSQTLEPLAAVRDKTLVLTNLWNRNSLPGDGHYVKTAGILTGETINKTIGVDLNSNGISMDQVAAQHVGHLTPLPSLELGTEAVRTGVDLAVGYTRVYGAHISWRGPTKPMAKEINPRLAYERLMRAGTQGEVSARQDRRLLDLVMDDAHSFRRQLGSSDRQRMDEYLESVRSLEQRLERIENSPGTPWVPLAPLDGFPAPPEHFTGIDHQERRARGRRNDYAVGDVANEHAEYVRLMLDLIVMAFQTDLTRVATLMFGNSVSNINFGFLDDVTGAHHSLSHHQRDEDKLRQYERIARWHVEQMVYLMQRMAEIPEGDRTLLDNSMVLWTSDLRDGDKHDPRNLPILLGGGGGNRIQSGQHLVYDRDTPLCNLYVSMLHAMGVPVQQFADSTGPLPGVLVDA